MLQVGQILHERYQLRQKLGYAANRQTWLATDLSTHSHELVVVKLQAFVDVQWQDIKMFEREKQILKHLNHHQIPKCQDYFCLNENLLWFGLVHEYIPGSSLQELLHEGKKFTQEQIRQIAIDVLNILVYLHELNPPVLHRDIKPSNLIWGEDEQIYLVDFGAVGDTVAKEGATFTIVGTYGYTPMEQFGGKAVPASDLYALGATLIHLLTNVAPADLPQKNLQIQFAQFVNQSPDFVAWLQQLCEPALEKRFTAARQALSALESGMVLQSSAIVNNSGQGGLFDLSLTVPEEIRGWNWGAFFLTPFWLVSNRVWIGLFALVPIVGFWMAIAMGIKGNEWAWKSRRWKSIEQFKTHQKRWAIAGIISGISVNLIFWHLSILLLLSNLI